MSLTWSAYGGRGRTIRTPCKGRTSKGCRTAKKTCLRTTKTEKRKSYCRKRKNAKRTAAAAVSGGALGAFGI
uniref:Uncharacterized protein n=1 Tax=viral metagenome TaxID=1070528 RepID=A0A6C0I3M8_9ZZZZ